MRACARNSDIPIKQYEYQNFYSEHRNKKYDWQIFHFASLWRISCVVPKPITVSAPPEHFFTGKVNLSITRTVFAYPCSILPVEGRKMGKNC